MHLAPSDYEKLTEFGAAFMSITDSALLLQVDADGLRDEIENPHSEAHVSYHSGRLQSIYDLNKSIVDEAKAGNPNAQLMAIELLKGSSMKNLR